MTRAYDTCEAIKGSSASSGEFQLGSMEPIITKAILRRESIDGKGKLPGQYGNMSSLYEETIRNYF